MSKFHLLLPFVLFVPVGLGIANELSDPTRPPPGFLADAPGASELPVLHSILVAPDRRSAVINGTVVRVGEVWSGVEVIAVAPGRITVRRDSQPFDLKLLTKVHKTSHMVRP